MRLNFVRNMLAHVNKIKHFMSLCMSVGWREEKSIKKYTVQHSLCVKL